jgi:hypothetical protein
MGLSIGQSTLAPLALGALMLQLQQNMLAQQQLDALAQTQQQMTSTQMVPACQQFSVGLGTSNDTGPLQSQQFTSYQQNAFGLGAFGGAGNYQQLFQQQWQQQHQATCTPGLPIYENAQPLMAPEALLQQLQQHMQGRQQQNPGVHDQQLMLSAQTPTLGQQSAFGLGALSAPGPLQSHAPAPQLAPYQPNMFGLSAQGGARNFQQLPYPQGQHQQPWWVCIPMLSLLTRTTSYVPFLFLHWCTASRVHSLPLTILWPGFGVLAYWLLPPLFKHLPLHKKVSWCHTATGKQDAGSPT